MYTAFLSATATLTGAKWLGDENQFVGVEDVEDGIAILMVEEIGAKARTPRTMDCFVRDMSVCEQNSMDVDLPIVPVADTGDRDDVRLGLAC